MFELHWVRKGLYNVVNDQSEFFAYEAFIDDDYDLWILDIDLVVLHLEIWTNRKTVNLMFWIFTTLKQ